MGSSVTKYKSPLVVGSTSSNRNNDITAKPTTLSGGEQQRVAIARALVNKPDLLIADEPTGNVDPEMGERLMRLILELNRRLSTTVLIATHDIALVDRLGAPVVRLENGLLVHQRGDVGAGGGHHV